MKRRKYAVRAKTKAATPGRTKLLRRDPFQLREPGQAARAKAPLIHVYGNRVVCETDKRGHGTPNGLSPLKIVLDASQGFVPLWAKGVTLNWRFRESSFTLFEDAGAAKEATRILLGEAVLAWGDAAPVKFAEQDDPWDFEIIIRNSDECDINGCVLASAFFPDGGRHELDIYPKMFEQDKKEQVETLIHEVGHIFGLRHFFANVSETSWPSEIFGTHKPFSIMNYGPESKLTDYDRADLKRLYETAWSGELTEVNGTEIRFVTPYSATKG